jgi:multidrug efflux pump
VGRKLAAALKDDPHLQNVTSNVMGGGQAVTVDINRDIAGRLACRC